MEKTIIEQVNNKLSTKNLNDLDIRIIEEALQLYNKRIEKEFDTNHFCDCEKWCNCWKEFKEKNIK